MNAARYLSESIGPRLAGTAKEFEASEYIAGQFRELGYPVSVHSFSFLNWIPLSRPKLRVLEPEQLEMALAPMGYTLPTPSGGVEGAVRKVGKMVLIPKLKEWDRYAVCAQDEEKAFLVGNPAAGDASPFPSGRPMLPEIGAIISKHDAERIDRWLDEGKTVRVRLFSECLQQPAVSRNVVARSGESDPELVVCAHYDSAFRAPGAVDNGSGVQALLDIAKLWREKDCGKTILFVAMAAEEPGLLGSYAFVHWLQEHNAISTIRACVNFDMIGHGTELNLRTGCHMDGIIDELIAQHQGKLNHPVRKVPVTSTSDNWPFHEAGIANMQFVATPFPVYHLSEDTMDQYDQTLVDDAEKMAMTLIPRLLGER